MRRKIFSLALIGILGSGQVSAQGINGAIGPPFFGTQTNNNAPAGTWGEENSSVLLVGSAVALTTATTANVTSVSLAAGDYEVAGEIWIAGTAATATIAQGGITTTSATMPAVPADNVAASSIGWNGSTPATFINSMGPIRISLASTTSVFLVAQATFSAGTVAAYGRLHWRRAR